MIVRQILISLGISIVITALVNGVYYLITGSLSWHSFLFLGLFFGLSFPFSRKRKSQSH